MRAVTTAASAARHVTGALVEAALAAAIVGSAPRRHCPTYRPRGLLSRGGHCRRRREVQRRGMDRRAGRRTPDRGSGLGTRFTGGLTPAQRPPALGRGLLLPERLDRLSPNVRQRMGLGPDLQRLRRWPHAAGLLTSPIPSPTIGRAAGRTAPCGWSGTPPTSAGRPSSRPPGSRSPRNARRSRIRRAGPRAGPSSLLGALRGSGRSSLRRTRPLPGSG